MAWKDRLFEGLGFVRRPAPFELLEEEKGRPGFWGAASQDAPVCGAAEEAEEEMPASFARCERRIREDFCCDVNKDVVLRRFRFASGQAGLCVCMTGMANSLMVNDFVLREAMRAALPDTGAELASHALQNIFTAVDAALETKWKAIRAAVLDGKSVVFIEGAKKAVLMDTRGPEHRSVGRAENEKTLRGSHESYSENLRTNITLLRRIIRMPDFVCEFRNAGGENGVSAAILYRGGIVNPALLAEVKRRLARVDTDMVLSMGTLEQLTENRSFSVFPQILSTERPDRTAAHIMEGHVALLLEGSPFAAVMPATLFTLMASAEDAYNRQPQGNIVRLVRFGGALASVLLPGAFVALTLYHQGLLPAEILITIINARRMVYASIGVEMILLLVVFQLIREAGMRIPGDIGQTVGIMGGLLLGQAAISANLASSVILIIVAVSALGNFCIPDYEMQIAASYLRLGFVFAAWLGGLLGFCAAFMALVGYTASLKSYGVPFLAPYAPKTRSKGPVLFRGRVTMHKHSNDYVNSLREDGRA